MQIAPGTILDRYRVEKRLGQGGMGVVYLARHIHIQSLHAVKVLLCATPELQRRLLSEAQAQARLRHPNIVPVTDFIDTEETQALVMEYVDGPTLHALLRQRRLTVPALDHIAIGLLSGLQAAHQAGLLHRDLKPANILMALGSDGRRIPRICDFGLVRERGAPSQTRSGVVMGTPGYMSPEQLRGRSDLDERADIFSMGAVLYELACGAAAFTGEDFFEVQRRVVHGQYVPLHQYRPDLPKRMVRAIGEALRADRQQRVHSIDRLLNLWRDEAPRVGGPAADLDGHPELDILAAGGPEIEQHLRGCVRCRVALRMFKQSLQRDGPPPHKPAPPHHMPPPTPPPSRTNLTDLDSFIGRSLELQEIITRLEVGCRQLTLVGPAGVGKSRLARQVAQQLQRPVLFCALEPAQTSSQLIQLLGKTLGTPIATEEDLFEVLDQHGSVLLILDTFEHLREDSVALLVSLLSHAPSAWILITSRRRLGFAGEQFLLVEPMDVESATRLFLARAQSARPDRSWGETLPTVIHQIVDRLDRLPLAIELAAARTAILSLEAINRRLSKRFRLLKQRNHPNSRHSTLRQAIDWSWTLLEDWERAALTQCSLFQGSFSLEAAEEIIDLDEFDEDALNGLQALREKSLLLVADDDRYVLLHAIQEYASEKRTDPSGPLRHAQWYAEHHRNTHDYEAVLQDQGNLWRAYDVAREAGAMDMALSLAQVLLFLVFRRGPYRAGLEVIEQLMAADPRPATHTLLRHEQAGLLTQLGRYTEASDSYAAALQWLRENGRSREEARLLAHYAGFLAARAQYREACEHAQVAYTLYTTLNEPANAARVRANLGEGLRVLGDPSAREHLEATLKQLQSFNDTYFQGIAHNSLARLDYDSDRLDESVAGFESALQCYTQVGAMQEAAVTRVNLGILQRAQGHHDDSIDSLTTAQQSLQALGERRFATVAAAELALLSLTTGDTQAQQQLQAATQVFASLGDPLFQCTYQSQLGAHCVLHGDPRAGLALLDEAVAQLEELQAPIEYGLARCHRAAALMHVGQFERARADLVEAGNLVETLGDAGARLQRMIHQQQETMNRIIEG